MPLTKVTGDVLGADVARTVDLEATQSDVSGLQTLTNSHSINLASNTQDIDALKDGQQSGVLVFTTYALLNAYTPKTSERKGSFKVTNDTVPANNGYYSWVSGSTYTKDAALVATKFDKTDDNEGVSGGAIDRYVSIETVTPTNDNIFNPDNLTRGYFIRADGTITSSSGYGYTQFIPVKAGVLYTQYNSSSFFSGPHLGRIRMYCLYDEDFNVVAGGSDTVSSTWVTTSSARYVRLTVYLSDVDEFTLVSAEGVDAPKRLRPFVGSSNFQGDSVAADKLTQEASMPRRVLQNGGVDKHSTRVTNEEALALRDSEALYITPTTDNIHPVQPWIRTALIGPRSIYTDSLNAYDLYRTRVEPGQEFYYGRESTTYPVCRNIAFMDENDELIEDLWIDNPNASANPKIIVPNDSRVKWFVWTSRKLELSGNDRAYINEVEDTFVPYAGRAQTRNGQEISVSKLANATVEVEAETPNAAVSRSTVASMIKQSDLVTLEELPLYERSNLYNPDARTERHYLEPGLTSLSPNDNYDVTNFIAVEEGKTYTANYNSLTTDIIRKIAYFTIDKAPIAGIGHSGSPAYVTNFTVPTGHDVAYVRLSFPTGENPVPNPLRDVPELYCLKEGTDSTYSPWEIPMALRATNRRSKALNHPNDIATRQDVIDLAGDQSGIRTTTLSNSEKLMWVGCSYDEGSYGFDGKNWISKLSNSLDWMVANTSVSGQRFIDTAWRLREDVTTRGTTPTVWKPTYIIAGNNGNEYFPSTTSETLDLYTEQVDHLHQAADAIGAKLIMTSDYHDNGNDWVEAHLKQWADDRGMDYLFIGRNGRDTVMDNSFQPFWSGSHYGTRTTAYHWKEMKWNLDKLPRPERGIKMFRVRDNEPLALPNLVYDSIEQRVTSWKELNVGERALSTTNDSYLEYDRLDEGNFTTETFNNEYNQMMDGSSVGFSDAGLFEVIIDRVNPDALKAVVQADTGITWYAVDNRHITEAPPIVRDKGLVYRVTEAVYDTFADPVGTTFTSPSVTTGAEFAFTGKLKSHEMGDGWFLCFDAVTNVSQSQRASGATTLNRVSGGTPVASETMMRQYRYSFEFFNQLNKPKGILRDVSTATTYNGTEYTIDLNETGRRVADFIQYDKVKLVGIKSGAFRVSNIYAEYTGGQPKQNRVRELEAKPFGTELQTSRGFDAAATGWTLGGNATRQMAADVRSYPSGALFDNGDNYHVELGLDSDGFPNVLAKSITVAGDETQRRGWQKVIVRVIARMFPKIYNPTKSGADYTNVPVITADSFDYGAITVRMGNETTKATFHNDLDIDWQEITFETAMPIGNSTFDLQVLRNPEVNKQDYEMQVYDVSVQLVD